MSLSIEAVDRLFSRLLVTYGTDFMARYAGQSENAVRAVWAHELAGFQAGASATKEEFRERMFPIAWALENLPERPPNIIEFRALCRRAPVAETKRLPEPAADPERIAQELAKLAPLRQPVPAPESPREWARRLIARHESGEHRSTPVMLQMARNALGMGA